MSKAKSRKLKAERKKIAVFKYNSVYSFTAFSLLRIAFSFLRLSPVKLFIAFCFLLSAFSFLRLSPVKLFIAFCFLLSAFSYQSCRFNPDLQGKGEIYLQGEWQQDSTTIERELIVASQYHIKFDCDSFFIKINDQSKINYGSDTCRNKGYWAEYIKGAYSQKNDTLFLKGQYCNANFTLKTNTDCFSTGPYQEFFKVNKTTDSLIKLAGTSMVIPINLKLVKKTSCTQKPL